MIMVKILMIMFIIMIHHQNRRKSGQSSFSSFTLDVIELRCLLERFPHFPKNFHLKKRVSIVSSKNISCFFFENLKKKNTNESPKSTTVMFSLSDIQLANYHHHIQLFADVCPFSIASSNFIWLVGIII